MKRPPCQPGGEAIGAAAAGPEAGAEAGAGGAGAVSRTTFVPAVHDMFMFTLCPLFAL